MPGLPYPAFRMVNAEPRGRQAVRLRIEQLDHDVGAGLVPVLRQGAHKGCPYASWFGGKVHGGDGKPSSHGAKPCGDRGPSDWHSYPWENQGSNLKNSTCSQGLGPHLPWLWMGYC